ncbi:hypothetical protein QUB63_32525 [Microcoleus sp. ARI1-B5]|uniref:hypothetical protein n=1 Tax=unclassified Microcoleus TaxID=2642155 RepID=UPI002FD0566D
MSAHPQRQFATFLTVAFLSSTFALATVGEASGKKIEALRDRDEGRCLIRV